MPFKYNTQIETWLRAKEFSDSQPGEALFPVREVRAGQFIKNHLYHYDNQGISHNHLYLKEIRFIRQDGNVSISKIIFYDGD